MENATPTLNQLLASGLVWAEEGTYVGEAASGEEVGLGQVDDPYRLERYLRENPTPEFWN